MRRESVPTPATFRLPGEFAFHVLGDAHREIALALQKVLHARDSNRLRAGLGCDPIAAATPQARWLLRA
jgi:hypothetical protein